MSRACRSSPSSRRQRGMSDHIRQLHDKKELDSGENHGNSKSDDKFRHAELPSRPMVSHWIRKENSDYALHKIMAT